MVDWKIFNRLSILPLFETITRSGAGVCFRLILACCKSPGMPSRTLSRSKLVCPSKTASARARWRNKCSLSSREVKSTGANVRVVTLPSAVIAKVATTNGRFVDAAPPPRLGTRERDEGVASTSFRFADLVFKSYHFLFHFAQPHARDGTAWLVKEVNDRAGKAANQNDKKTQRPDQNGFCFRNTAQAVEHDLQDLFPKSNSGKTDW